MPKNLRTLKTNFEKADGLGISFLKDEHTSGKKRPEMVVKWSFMSNFHFETVFMYCNNLP